MNMLRTIPLTIVILFISTTSMTQSRAQLNKDPAAVKFVTSDIENAGSQTAIAQGILTWTYLFGSSG